MTIGAFTNIPIEADIREFEVTPTIKASQHYPVSNDFCLGESYSTAVKEICEEVELKDTTPGVLIVGNGSFESAAPAFVDLKDVLGTDELHVIHIDSNPLTLQIQNFIRNALLNSDNPEDFSEQVKVLNTIYKRASNPLGRTGVMGEYIKQGKAWECPLEPVSAESQDELQHDHFLSSNEHFEKSKNALGKLAFSYRLVDIRDRANVSSLGRELSEQNVTTVLANVTNAYDWEYAGTESKEHISETLPVHPHSRVIRSLCQSLPGIDYRESGWVSQPMRWLDWDLSFVLRYQDIL